MSHLRDIRSGTRIFVDTNIFALYFSHPGDLGKACRDFFVRTTSRELQGFTSASVAAETIHRVMVAEAAAMLSLSSQATVEHLQKHPSTVQKLTRHLQVASDMHRLGINILPLTYKELHSSKNFRFQFGLLTNDSLILAVMQAHKLQHLATHDAGFYRVSSIQVWGPA